MAKPLNNLLTGVVDIGADIAASDLVVCIKICRSGYCVVATDAVPALQRGHMQKQSPQRLSCHKPLNKLLGSLLILLLILLLVILLYV